MKKEITITPSLTREWMSGGNASASSGLITTLKKIVSVIVSISYNVLGFVALLVAWYFISLITKGELPGPLATSVVFWELISDPFYDYGPNDKGIALQLLSSLARVFTRIFVGIVDCHPCWIINGCKCFLQKGILSNCSDIKTGFTIGVVSHRTCCISICQRCYHFYHRDHFFMADIN